MLQVSFLSTFNILIPQRCFLVFLLLDANIDANRDVAYN